MDWAGSHPFFGRLVKCLIAGKRVRICGVTGSCIHLPSTATFWDFHRTKYHPFLLTLYLGSASLSERSVTCKRNHIDLEHDVMTQVKFRRI